MQKVSKPKVYVDAFAISTKRRSGIGHVLLNLLLELDKNPGECEFVLVASPKAIKFIKNEFGFKNFAYKIIPLPGWVFNGLVIYKLMPAVDVYLGRGLYLFPNFTKWPLLFSKSVVYIHDLSFMVYPEVLRPGVLGALSRNLITWTGRCTKIIAISENTKKDIVRYLKIDPSKIRTIYNGVSPAEYYKRGKAETQKVLKKYGLPKDYLLFVSNIEPRKNLSTLFKAYRLLPKNIAQKHPIVIVGGESWGSESLMLEIKEMKALGYQIIRPKRYVEDADLPAVYSAASMLIHPALYEGFALSPLQAMVCGTPTIVANNSSMTELFSDSSLTFDTLDADDLKGCILRVLSDSKLRQSLITKGKRRARELTWHRSAEDLSRLLKELI